MGPSMPQPHSRPASVMENWRPRTQANPNYSEAPNTERARRTQTNEHVRTGDGHQDRWESVRTSDVRAGAMVQQSQDLRGRTSNYLPASKVESQTGEGQLASQEKEKRRLASAAMDSRTRAKTLRQPERPPNG